ncbi:hypothetical protein ACWDV7_34965 [Streptomyces sp. NPDC003362]
MTDVDATGPVALGTTVDRTEASFWWLREGVRTPIGSPLDVNLVGAASTADFHAFRLTCG